MAQIVHIVPARDEANGVWRLANLLTAEDGGTVQLGCDGINAADEVWVHGMWLPCEWIACWRSLRRKKRLVRMTHGSLSPVYLRYHGWKKWLVGPIERFFLRRADRIVATCEAEKRWIEEYLGKRCPPIEVTDIKRFFDLSHKEHKEHTEREGKGKLHLLYLGRRHPLKGLEYLEAAVRDVSGSGLRVSGSGEEGRQIKVSGDGEDGWKRCELRIESDVFGEEKEKVWAWCDVLVLPTLSENFGLVVAEALERGKRVITTDGAPAWGGECLEFRVSSCGLRVEGIGERGADLMLGEDSRTERVEKDVGEIWSGYGGRLIYLKGYRGGRSDARITLLRQAIEWVSREG